MGVSAFGVTEDVTVQYAQHSGNVKRYPHPMIDSCNP